MHYSICQTRKELLIPFEHLINFCGIVDIMNRNANIVCEYSFYIIFTSNSFHIYHIRHFRIIAES